MRYLGVRRVFSPTEVLANAVPMATTILPSFNEAALWRELGQQLRVDSIRATDVAGSGHPTSSMSAADLLAVLAANARPQPKAA